jgi:hypothetical protein
MRVKLKNRHVYGDTFLCRALHAVICITQFIYYLSIRSNYLNLTHLFWASNIYMIEIGVLYQQFPIMYSISQLGSSCELNIFLKLIDRQQSSLSHSIRQSNCWETWIVINTVVISLWPGVYDKIKCKYSTRPKAVVNFHIFGSREQTFQRAPLWNNWHILFTASTCSKKVIYSIPKYNIILI